MSPLRMSTVGSMLNVTSVTKRYSGQDTDAVAGVSFVAVPGEFVALMGPSGCGKSTLLHLCGAMDRPDRGQILLGDTNLARLGDDQLTLVRRQRIGFVFQFFNLLPTLTLVENVALPLLLAGASPAEATRRARSLGDRVGLASRLDAYPAQVSGGEMQRAAIARAIVHSPALLIADEPTGNLDSGNGARVLELLVELNASLRLTILLATHASDIAAAAHRTLHMRDGQFA
ncbi:ABC transporter ATP-binding protein YxdL [Luteitalea pratensis]|uniref:ABC transporter ATP-binding protein YxdL n=1 Tax=Luteitalea pratensis TaxID=1855912 RepID=A0A143PN79_LUTPR|nr:ABC transporter ATP-binding protein [Luteitalea pratensis]AMY10097.1 ABC transporter ATP-binding protein YxdL [Luteitalea pratensis]